MSFNRTYFLLISLLLSAYTYAQGQAYKLIPPQYELEHIKLNFKGNPGSLHSIKADREDNLWLLGTEGLHVFDGNNVITYRNGSREFQLLKGSGSNDFPYGVTDHSGFLWLTDVNNRIILFNPYKRMVVDSLIVKPVPGEVIINLAYSTSSGFFISTLNIDKRLVSIYQKKGNSAEKIFATDFTLNQSIFYLFSANEHWIADGFSATRIAENGKKATRYSYPNGSISQLQVFADDSSVYFADFERQAIYTWNNSTDRLEEFMKLPPLERGMVQAFYIDGNKVYLGSNLYLFIIDRAAGTYQNLSPQFTELARKEAANSMSDQLVQFLRQEDGSILLQTYSNIYRIKKIVPPRSRFRLQVDAEINSSKPVSYRALTEDGNKNIYASYYSGLSKKTTGTSTFKTIPTAQYLNGDKISTYSLNYWNGSLLWNNIKIELATGKYTYMFDSVSAGHCTQLLHHDSLWLYQWNTRLLHCFDLRNAVLKSYPFEPMTYASENNVGYVDVNDMITDAGGENLWVSSHALGLCLINKKGKLLKQYTKKDLSTTDNYLTDLELKGNQLWFGCTDGLGVLNTITGKARIYKNPFVNNGLLANRSIFSIQPDSAGNFYLGSSHGLLYFDTKAASFFNLAEGHPLSTPEFNRASVFKASDNRYYFGSTDGLYSFTPDELEFFKSSNAIGHIKLYGISVFSNKAKSYHYLSQNLDGLGKLMLNPFDNNIEFSFSVPEFYRNVYYSYRIREQGANWTEYKPDNKIQLYGLQPGSYTLEVKASTSLSDENASYYSLPIEMKQVWYKKWWVISLFLLAVAALLFGLLRYRFNQKIKRQKDLAALRTKISSDLHDDVGTILSGLAMQSQMLTYSVNEEQKEPLKEISQMSRDAMEHMRDTVWAMDSRKDKYENLVDRMRDFAEKNLPLKKITHDFVIENVEGKKFIDPEKRQAIYLIFKEAITNIIKHSDGNHVVVHFTEEKNKTILHIKDNGTEKAKSNSDGLGMSNMKMRAEKINGCLVTKYENGFIVELVI